MRIVGKLKSGPLIKNNKFIIKNRVRSRIKEDNVFIVEIEDFHELLFGRFEVIFYNDWGPFSLKTGYARIPFRSVINHQNNITVDVYSPSSYHAYDNYFDKSKTVLFQQNIKIIRMQGYIQLPSLGKDKITQVDDIVKFCQSSGLFEKCSEHSDKPHVDRSVVWSRFLFFSNTFYKIWDCFSELRKGSLSCHLLFWAGLIKLKKTQNQIKSVSRSQNNTSSAIVYHSSNVSSFHFVNDFRNSSMAPNRFNNAIKSNERADNLILNRYSGPNTGDYSSSLPQGPYNLLCAKKSNKDDTSEGSLNNTQELLKNTLNTNFKLHLNFSNKSRPNISSFCNKFLNLAPNRENDLMSSTDRRSFESMNFRFENIPNKKQRAIFLQKLNQLPMGGVLKKLDFFCEYFLDKFYFSVASYNNYFLTQCLKRHVAASNVKEGNRLVIEIAGIDEECILNVDMHEGDFHTPNVIFYDKIDQEIVVSLRGTQSHLDALKDLDCKYIRFLNGFGHSGIIKSAFAFTKKYINRLKFFCRIHKTKKILLSGHSLGGAVASCVNIIISHQQHLSEYDVRTIAFGAPPFLSENVGYTHSSNIINIVNNHDIVPTLSYGSVLDLKYKCISLAKGKIKEDMDLIRLVEEIENELEKSSKFPKLYIPDQIFHLIHSHDSLNQSSGLSIQKSWEIIKKSGVDFSKIKLKSSMLLDHQFKGYISALSP